MILSGQVANGDGGSSRVNTGNLINFGGMAQGGYSSYNVKVNMYGSSSSSYGTKVTGFVVIGDVRLRKICNVIW